jgi:flagellar hook assembly protein FlgD
MFGARPNPFNPTTTISYQLPAYSRVSLRVYDTAGRLVSSLAEGWQEAGVHEVIFDGSNLTSGLYFVRIQAGSFSSVQKIVLLK